MHATETSLPLVSIIMPAFNGEPYIGAAIRSVLAQSYARWELLILDDGSADRTAEIAEAFEKSDPRIRLFRNPKNLGAAQTRNRGFALAQGEWIALLDCDDIWHTDKLEKQLALASRGDILYCSYALIDESGRLMLERAGLIAYAHGDYYRLGERSGDFGFSVRHKKTVGYGKRPREKNGARRHDAAATASSDGDGRASADLGTESSAPPVRRGANTSAVSDSDVNASERSDADAAKRHKSAPDRAHSRPASAKKRTEGSASVAVSARGGSRGPRKRCGK